MSTSCLRRLPRLCSTSTSLRPHSSASISSSSSSSYKPSSTLSSSVVICLPLHRRFASSFNPTKSRIGFIGLGNMGVHMAHNLLKAGHPLSLYDVAPKGIDTVKAYAAAINQTVRVARSPADVALDCRVLITMLPSSPHVLDVYTNEKTGILSAFPIPRSSSTRPAHSASTSSPQPSTSTPLFIDSSTIDPLTARTLASLASDHSCAMVDAPVSGGINGAEAATLTFMVGGTPSAFSAAQSYLSRMGRNIVHCGSAGTGQTAKVCNNLVLAVSMAAVSEAMVLGQRLGMDAKKLAGIFNTSTARCWASDTYNPVPGVQAGVPSGRDYVGGFGSDLMRKDLGLAREAAKGVGMEVEMGERVWRMYEDIGKKGWGQKDFSIIYQHLMQRAQQGEGGQEAGKGDSAQPATEKSQ